MPLRQLRLASAHQNPRGPYHNHVEVADNLRAARALNLRRPLSRDRNNPAAVILPSDGRSWPVRSNAGLGLIAYPHSAKNMQRDQPQHD